MAKKKSSAVADKNIDFTAPWKDNKKKTSGGSMQKIEKGKKSIWTDDQTQFRKDADDDLKLKPAQLAERGKRPAPKMVKVVCERCSKKYTVHEALDNDYYICENCITKRPLGE